MTKTGVTPSCAHAAALSVSRGWTASPHSHPFREMIVVNRGALEVRVNGSASTLGPGDFIVYSAGLVHSETAVGSRPPQTEIAFVSIRKGADDVPCDPMHDTEGRVRAIVGWMVREAVSAYRNRHDGMDAHLASLLYEITKLASHKPAGPLERTRSYMRSALSQSHTIAELARGAHMSPYGFIRKYKQLTGNTPMDDLRRMRVEAACELLLTTDLPVKAIAAEVGFCDEYHFSKTFRKYQQIPPGAYRRSVEDGE